MSAATVCFRGCWVHTWACIRSYKCQYFEPLWSIRVSLLLACSVSCQSDGSTHSGESRQHDSGAKFERIESECYEGPIFLEDPKLLNFDILAAGSAVTGSSRELAVFSATGKRCLLVAAGKYGPTELDSTPGVLFQRLQLGVGLKVGKGIRVIPELPAQMIKHQGSFVLGDWARIVGQNVDEDRGALCVLLDEEAQCKEFWRFDGRGLRQLDVPSPGSQYSVPMLRKAIPRGGLCGWQTESGEVSRLAMICKRKGADSEVTCLLEWTGESWNEYLLWENTAQAARSTGVIPADIRLGRVADSFEAVVVLAAPGTLASVSVFNWGHGLEPLQVPTVSRELDSFLIVPFTSNSTNGSLPDGFAIVHSREAGYPNKFIRDPSGGGTDVYYIDYTSGTRGPLSYTKIDARNCFADAHWRDGQLNSILIDNQGSGVIVMEAFDGSTDYGPIRAEGGRMVAHPARLKRNYHALLGPYSTRMVNEDGDGLFIGPNFLFGNYRTPPGSDPLTTVFVSSDGGQVFADSWSTGQVTARAADVFE